MTLFIANPVLHRRSMHHTHVSFGLDLYHLAGGGNEELELAKSAAASFGEKFSFRCYGHHRSHLGCLCILPLLADSEQVEAAHENVHSSDR